MKKITKPSMIDGFIVLQTNNLYQAHLLLSVFVYYINSYLEFSDQMTPSGTKMANKRMLSPTSENKNIFFAFGFIFGT